MNNIITVNDLLKQFNFFEVIYKGNTNNVISIPVLNRTGIELAGEVYFNNKMSPILWSTNEFKYLSSLKSEKEIIRKIDAILKLSPPVIIVTTRFDKHIKTLLKVAQKYKTPILKTSLSSSSLHLRVGQWINEKLAKYNLFHGTLIDLFGLGVLITGESGVGKSEVAMELVKKGHIFIGDDAIDIANIGNRLYGKPNDTCNNFIEVRGIGILDVSRMFGIEKVKKQSDINLVIELQKLENTSVGSFERLGTENKYTEICGVKIPKYVLPITPGRNMSDLIESAVIDYKLKESGYNSANEYIKNIKKINKKV